MTDAYWIARELVAETPHDVATIQWTGVLADLCDEYDALRGCFTQADVALLCRLSEDAMAAAARDGTADDTPFLQRAVDAVALANRIAAVSIQGSA